MVWLRHLGLLTVRQSLPYKVYVIPDDCGYGVIDTVKKEDKPIVPFNMESITYKEYEIARKEGKYGELPANDNM